MKERPILFSAPMIRALLEGRKTQTRRIVKWPDWVLPADYENVAIELSRNPCLGLMQDGRPVGRFCCPYGREGDVLWARETWAKNRNQTSDTHEERSVVYRADGAVRALDNGVEIPWRPSIHMPRWASRITLEVTGVRVERLQDISEADARAEGARPYRFAGGETWWQGYQRDEHGELNHQQVTGPSPPDWMIEPHKMGSTEYLDRTAAQEFRFLWESLNGPVSWDANPFVWCISFRGIAP